jgi:phosphomannomutase
VHHQNVGAIRYPERTNEIYINRYLESLKIDIIKQKKYKILMDYSYGLAASIFPYILGKLNCEALSLHDFIDAGRYNPDPSLVANREY